MPLFISIYRCEGVDDDVPFPGFDQRIIILNADDQEEIGRSEDRDELAPPGQIHWVELDVEIAGEELITVEVWGRPEEEEDDDDMLAYCDIEVPANPASLAQSVEVSKYPLTSLEGKDVGMLVLEWWGDLGRSFQSLGGSPRKDANISQAEMLANATKEQQEAIDMDGELDGNEDHNASPEGGTDSDGYRGDDDYLSADAGPDPVSIDTPQAEAIEFEDDTPPPAKRSGKRRDTLGNETGASSPERQTSGGNFSQFAFGSKDDNPRFEATVNSDLADTNSPADAPLASERRRVSFVGEQNLDVKAAPVHNPNEASPVPSALGTPLQQNIGELPDDPNQGKRRSLIRRRTSLDSNLSGSSDSNDAGVSRKPSDMSPVPEVLRASLSKYRLPPPFSADAFAFSVGQLLMKSTVDSERIAGELLAEVDPPSDIDEDDANEMASRYTATRHFVAPVQISPTEAKWYVRNVITQLFDFVMKAWAKAGKSKTQDRPELQRMQRNFVTAVCDAVAMVSQRKKHGSSAGSFRGTFNIKNPKSPHNRMRRNSLDSNDPSTPPPEPAAAHTNKLRFGKAAADPSAAASSSLATSAGNDEVNPEEVPVWLLWSGRTFARLFLCSLYHSLLGPFAHKFSFPDGYIGPIKPNAYGLDFMDFALIGGVTPPELQSMYVTFTCIAPYPLERDPPTLDLSPHEFTSKDWANDEGVPYSEVKAQQQKKAAAGAVSHSPKPPSAGAKTDKSPRTKGFEVEDVEMVSDDDASEEPEFYEGMTEEDAYEVAKRRRGVITSLRSTGGALPGENLDLGSNDSFTETWASILTTASTRSMTVS